MLHLASSFVVLLLAVGLWFRHRRPQLHLRLMISAFVVDLLLVLYIEISRHAVEKVVSRVSPVLWFHAAVSVGVLLCYVVMILLGRCVLAGQEGFRKRHFAVGMTFVALRSLNYVTSYMVT
jgi:MFS-type transporter involved in bile tolerance (Atg22 family)